MELAKLLPDQWRLLLHDALNTESFKQLELFLDQEYREQEIFPPLENLFHAFRLTPPDQVRAIILGQDPYHDNGQAHGLAFRAPRRQASAVSAQHLQGTEHRHRSPDPGKRFPGILGKTGSIASQYGTDCTGARRKFTQKARLGNIYGLRDPHSQRI